MVVSNLLAVLRREIRNQKGVIAVEYAVLGALIIVLCVVSIGQLGQRVKELFTLIAGV